MKCINYKIFIIIFFCLIFSHSGKLLSQPWRNPLMTAYSSDGITFSTPALFQDSSGVPSAIRWKGDTLICVFQLFRQPVGSGTWDKVAVKFSYNNGTDWTMPVPIVVNGIPQTYQRPFDPAIVVIQNDSLRIYFSSSNGMPPPGGDSIINTYSARSGDGINYFFEPGARVDQPSNRVIDPSVVYFNNSWHYIAPIGAPQQGAYHYVSPDGLNFSIVPNIPSDPLHNWTGNYMVNGITDLRFYGTGVPYLWYNSTPNGGVWSGYVNTNISGGDPTVVKISNSNYLIIFTGAPYTGITKLDEVADSFQLFQNFPNPFNPVTKIKFTIPAALLFPYGLSGNPVSLKVYDLLGKQVAALVNESALGGQPGTYEVEFDGSNLTSGTYFYRLTIGDFACTKMMVLLK
jgi:hypothetical protein